MTGPHDRIYTTSRDMTWEPTGGLEPPAFSLPRICSARRRENRRFGSQSHLFLTRSMSKAPFPYGERISPQSAAKLASIYRRIAESVMKGAYVVESVVEGAHAAVRAQIGGPTFQTPAGRIQRCGLCLDVRPGSASELREIPSDHLGPLSGRSSNSVGRGRA